MKWIVRGGSKLARGNVHPCEVIRALMIDLENIGTDVRGADVDKKLAETQLCAVLTVNPYVPSDSNEIIPNKSMVSTISTRNTSSSETAATETALVQKAEIMTENLNGDVKDMTLRNVGGNSTVETERQIVGNRMTTDSLSTPSVDTATVCATTINSGGTAKFNQSPMKTVISTSTGADIVLDTPSAISISSSSLSLSSYTLHSVNSDSKKCSLAQSLFEYSEDADGKHSISRSASAVRSFALLMSTSEIILTF